MAKRNPYSLVLIGARKASARTKYLEFLSGRADRPSRIGTKGPRSQRYPLALRPFAGIVPNTVLVATSASKEAVLALQGFISIQGRVVYRYSPLPAEIQLTFPGAGLDFLEIKGFSPARIIRKVYQTRTATVKKSETTGLTYGYKASSTLSIPIGRKNATDSLVDALSAAGGAIRGADGSGLTKVFLKEEEIPA